MTSHQPAELSRPVPVARLTERHSTIEVCADADELARIARRLGIPRVARLVARFSLRHLPTGVIEADGRLEAHVVQECVVSLEPVEQAVAEDFTVRFVPGAIASDQPLDPDAIDEIPYEGADIDFGEAAVEQLALALDPFPRKPGVALWSEEAPATASVHPFASLRPRRDAT